MSVHTTKFAFSIICNLQEADRIISLFVLPHEFSAKIVRIFNG